MRVYGANLRRVMSDGDERKALAFVSGIGVIALVQSSSATAQLAAVLAHNAVGIYPRGGKTGVLATVQRHLIGPNMGVGVGVVVQLLNAAPHSGAQGRVSLLLVGATWQPASFMVKRLNR